MLDSINTSIVLCAVLLIVVAPFQSLAQRAADDDKGNLQDAERLAKIDAENDVNAVKWLGCGLIGTALGVGIAYFVVPSPPPERLMGKSYRDK